jgi:hypothetical protein
MNTEAQSIEETNNLADIITAMFTRHIVKYNFCTVRARYLRNTSVNMQPDKVDGVWRNRMAEMQLRVTLRDQQRLVQNISVHSGGSSNILSVSSGGSSKIFFVIIGG